MSILHISSRQTFQPAGRIEMDETTGACRFLDGDDKLRIHIERTLSKGVHIEMVHISPSDPKRFETAFACVLALGDFCTEDMADRLSSRSKGVTLPHVMS